MPEPNGTCVQDRTHRTVGEIIERRCEMRANVVRSLLVTAISAIAIATGALALPVRARGDDDNGVVTFRLTLRDTAVTPEGVESSPIDTARRGPVWSLTLIGNVPDDAEFAVVNTSQGDVFTVYSLCGPGRDITPCQSGGTYTHRITRWPGGDPWKWTMPFQYVRIVDGRWITLYEDQVTPTRANPHPSFHVTYDFNRTVPDTAIAPDAGAEPVTLASVAAALVLVTVAANARFRRYPRP
jgi:hypothetical protein